ncbi:hypothetical protein DERP_000495 [Dermatophagoides pteronyssinus]|uniref:Uncharacterized protein n=1 Tax=Dermatophagoides pteronyssinus TaxID=6956 RepID=A0ABQ8J0B2_DERPT|nr:hypothetical protein DERP_000495 [Dermatophagoides pteronyssinus]
MQYEAGEYIGNNCFLTLRVLKEVYQSLFIKTLSTYLIIGIWIPSCGHKKLVTCDPLLSSALH